MINDITLTSRTNDFANVSSTNAGLILINCGTRYNIGGTRYTIFFDTLR